MTITKKSASINKGKGVDPYHPETDHAIICEKTKSLEEVNMKRSLKVLALVMAVVMMLGLISGCQSEPGGTTTTQNNANTVTVSWYEGSKELKTEKVEKGATITSWTPTSEGKEFTGWYAEASLTEPFDFTQPIEADTDIFAAFKSNTYVEDTNQYYFIGTGAGDMSKSGWDHANSQANLMMVKDTSVTDKNIYTITITMYAGDRFQICYGGAWDGQQGIGYIPGAEYVDGVNEYDKTEYTAADKKVAAVKDADGNVVFTGSDEYNKSYEVWNIILAEGMDGVYKFTFTTNPASAQYNELTYELVEKLDPMTETHKMHLIGAFNNWTEGDENLLMTESEDGKFWTTFLTVTPDMYVDYGQADLNTTALKVFNSVNGGYYSDTADNIFLGEGTYCIKYTVEGDVVEYQKLDYYVVGTFVDAEGKAVNFAIKEGVTPKLENGTATFTATDVTGLGDFSWMKDQGKPGVMAIKVVFGCELGIKDWYSDDANGGDNFYVNAGSVTVTLADGVVTVS